MVTTYPPLQRMSVITIAGTFHFFFDHTCVLPKEICYTSAPTSNLDFNKKTITFPQN